MTFAGLSVGVIGAGAWGTALAAVAARAGHRVILWSRSAETAAAMNAGRTHPAFPGVALDHAIEATARPEDLRSCDLIIIATPAQAVRATLDRFSDVLGRSLPIIITAKGIEIASGKFMVDVLTDTYPGADPYILSGPSFAAEVMRGKPAAVTIAGRDLDLAAGLAAKLSIPTFRIYTSVDLLGVQLGGAVKNVLAIACGISDGRGLGDSARAALTTRSFSELLRFGRALGAEPNTLTGLSGLGDLLLTCASRQSRNFSFGFSLGRNEPVSALLSASDTTIEGIPTARAIARIAGERNLDLPICSAVNAILEDRLSVDAAIGQLLARPLRPE